MVKVSLYLFSCYILFTLHIMCYSRFSWKQSFVVDEIPFLHKNVSLSVSVIGFGNRSHRKVPIHRSQNNQNIGFD